MLVGLPPVKTWLNQKGFQETSGPMRLVSHLPLDHPSVPHHLNLELELQGLHLDHQPLGHQLLGHQHLDQLDLVLKTSIRRLKFFTVQNCILVNIDVHEPMRVPHFGWCSHHFVWFGKHFRRCAKSYNYLNFFDFFNPSLREGFKKKIKNNYGKFHIGSYPPPSPPCYGKFFLFFFLKLDHFLRTFCKKCIFNYF